MLVVPAEQWIASVKGGLSLEGTNFAPAIHDSTGTQLPPEGGTDKHNQGGC